MRALTQSLFAACFLSISLYGQTDGLRQKNFNVKKNVALEGYDPVSYFDVAPLEGDEDISTVHAGITYYFANESNRSKFRSAPEKYEPAYGGWCAYAMGDSGEKVKIDPETYKIIKGKLYLFYNFWGNNTLDTWNKNEPALKSKADKNWTKFVK